MKQLIILSFLMTITFLAGPALSADLSSQIKLRVDWSNQYLDLAEGQISSGRAEFANKNIKGAVDEFNNIAKFYSGSYDTAHPTLTNLKQRIETVAVKVKNAQDAPVASQPEIKSTAAPATPAKSTAAPVINTVLAPRISDPLPSTMIYEMKEYNGGMDWTLQNINKMKIKAARDYLKSEHPWKTKKQWYKGKFHPQHADVLALDAKIAKAEKLVAEFVAKADATQKSLVPVLVLLQQNDKELKKAREAAYWKVRDISSSLSDGDADKLLVFMEKAREPVARVNALLPAARQAVKDFHQQYPDWEALEQLITNDHEVKTSVKKVDRFPDIWLNEVVGSVVNTALDEAEKNVKMYGLDRLAGIQGSDEAMQLHAANSAQEHAVVFAEIMLDMIDVLLPELPTASQAALPEFVTARKQALKRAVQLRNDITTVKSAVRKVLKNVKDAAQRQLAAARFPKSSYHGGQWDAAENVIRVAFEEKIRDKKLVKIDIYRPWEVRDEAKWMNDHWQISTYRYIGANCLAKLSSDKYRVYRMNFRNKKMADGSWSKLEQWSVGHSYEMLKQNIGK